ncbi:hypothetical protein BC834DRAFT_975112 [Gloeopeniophorella convolvens]|nr:hypothetical protein BC834DRAFT_975112 [Gloeopeniophorella convolvens]
MPDTAVDHSIIEEIPTGPDVSLTGIPAPATSGDVPGYSAPAPTSASSAGPRSRPTSPPVPVIDSGLSYGVALGEEREQFYRLYNDKTEEEDKKMTEGWKADAEGILVFIGLFSATVATFLTLSFQNLQLNSQDASAFYLAQLYQLNVGQNGSAHPVPSTLSDPSAFSPSTSAVWVNALWFASLVTSLTCALLATLLQQWARRFLRITQTRYNPERRARIRSFMAQGVDKLYLSWAVEALPALLHIAVFLFFAGLVIFLFGTNHTVFTVVFACVGITVGLYGCISLMPVIRRDSPYYTPLSAPVWLLLTSAAWVVLRNFHRISLEMRSIDALLHNSRHSVEKRLYSAMDNFRRRMRDGLVKEIGHHVENNQGSSRLHAYALLWAVDNLDEDAELEKLVTSIPGYLGPERGNDFTEEEALRVGNAILSFALRPPTFGTADDGSKHQRAAICCKAFTAIPSSPLCAFELAIRSPHLHLFTSTDFALLAESCLQSDSPRLQLLAQCAISVLIHRLDPFDDEKWFSLILRRLYHHEEQRFGKHGDGVDGVAERNSTILVAFLLSLIREETLPLLELYEDTWLRTLEEVLGPEEEAQEGRS